MICLAPPLAVTRAECLVASKSILILAVQYRMAQERSGLIPIRKELEETSVNSPLRMVQHRLCPIKEHRPPVVVVSVVIPSPPITDRSAHRLELVSSLASVLEPVQVRLQLDIRVQDMEAAVCPNSQPATAVRVPRRLCLAATRPVVPSTRALHLRAATPRVHPVRELHRQPTTSVPATPVATSELATTPVAPCLSRALVVVT